MEDARLESLCLLLEELRLPLFLTLRMEDERITYLMQPQDIPLWDLSMFAAKYPNIPILLCNARYFELCWLSDTMREYENLYADCSGLKNGLFGMDEVQDPLIQSRLVYGSLAPLLCMKSTILLLDRSNIAQEQKEAIYSAKNFLAFAERSRGASAV